MRCCVYGGRWVGGWVGWSYHEMELAGLVGGNVLVDPPEGWIR